MSRKIELAKKLKELADRGVGGERENATVALERHMKKHGITYDELEELVEKHYHFNVDVSKHKLFAQIAWHVTNNHQIYGHKTRKTLRFVKCTAEQAIEIQAKFDFYSDALKEAQADLYSAFIHKHNLFGESEESDDEEDIDLDRISRITKIYQGLEEKEYQKRIGNG